MAPGGLWVQKSLVCHVVIARNEERSIQREWVWCAYKISTICVVKVGCSLRGFHGSCPETCVTEAAFMSNRIRSCRCLKSR
jgi:hypothetical protein